MSEKNCPECGRDLRVPTTVCGRCGKRLVMTLPKRKRALHAAMDAENIKREPLAPAKENP